MKHFKLFVFNLVFCFLLAAAGTAHLFLQGNEPGNQEVQDKGQVLRTSFERIAREQLKDYLIANFSLDREKAGNFARWIQDASFKFNVPESLLTSLIMTESDFRYNAVSHVGAVGPTQVVPKFWSQICDGDIINDPEANVHCGAKALTHYYHKRCDRNPTCAVTMYNVGPTAYFSPSIEAKAAMERYLAKINRGLLLMDGIEVTDIKKYW